MGIGNPVLMLIFVGGQAFDDRGRVNVAEEAREVSRQYGDRAYRAWVSGLVVTPTAQESFEVGHSEGWGAGYDIGKRDGIAEGIRQAREAAASVHPIDSALSGSDAAVYAIDALTRD